MMDQHSKEPASMIPVEDFDHYFQVDIEAFGRFRTFDLKPNGGSILVTKDDRKGK